MKSGGGCAVPSKMACLKDLRCEIFFSGDALRLKNKSSIIAARSTNGDATNKREQPSRLQVGQPNGVK
jgi:hypothetical protein